MTEIFWVEDYMSGEVMEHRYYSTREEAATQRNELGYGLVRSFELQDGGVIPKRDDSEMYSKDNRADLSDTRCHAQPSAKSSDLVAFRATPGEKIDIS